MTSIEASPRNLWVKINQALNLERNGDVLAARKLVDAHRFHPRMTAQLYSSLNRYFDLQQNKTVKSEQYKINSPAEFTENPRGIWTVPFRSLRMDEYLPKPFPSNMALPDLIGTQNDCQMIYSAAPFIANLNSTESTAFCIFYQFIDAEGFKEFVQGLIVQDDFQVSSFYIFASDEYRLEIHRILSHFGLVAEVLSCPFLSKEGQMVFAKGRHEDSVNLILRGGVSLDRGCFARARNLLNTSDSIVLPLFELSQDVEANNFYAIRSNPKFQRYPFRNIESLNLVVSNALVDRVGPFDPEFTSSMYAAREFGFRCYNVGAYFSPLLVRAISDQRDQSSTNDHVRYVERCPNSWDRKSDGRYTVPKVSIYIPAYNASKYIIRAVSSVLDQDVEDLEVCIANDGSTDGTMAVLSEAFGSEDRVRYQTFKNGGIGHASNQAISMAHGIYIGQLDSDDCLKPGAVRRMMEYLDDHPTVTCCYGSCERVDKDGNYLQPEYSWKHFSRRKMMLTSIAHHFRMFRRSAWERTGRFRTDITNAVDYDIFLKLCETGEFHHINEVLYQRRWHGENTSNVNEGFQTVNTYRVQRESLKRQGLKRYWDVHVLDPKQPRRVGYQRVVDTPQVVFWPNYSRANPYQKLLYKDVAKTHEVISGSILDAIKLQERNKDNSGTIFHLHWINFLFVNANDRMSVRFKVREFLKNLVKFKEMGGKLVWTIHNTVSHDNIYAEIERGLSQRISELADVVHFHSVSSIDEVRAVFPVEDRKIRISRHGNYLGVYDSFITRDAAREALGIEKDADVVLFAGQVRPYKGVSELINAFRELLSENAKAFLVIAGAVHDDFWSRVTQELTPQEADRIKLVDRFLDDAELQVYFRAADIAAFPYKKILTSGSLLLSLSFGVPVVIPNVGMTREVLEGSPAGFLYDQSLPNGLHDALENAFKRKNDGGLLIERKAALEIAKKETWPNLAETLFSAI
ncbi:glycosyltransferase [Donghicola mangrovi]|uniref:Glycosyltransferase n=1 Tax=Donghicola mangrovi TaxID=2729614 RepID=A0A850Q9S8_9RHOB|nr:glycosyltransferase [Donghicola mangrovi]NVO25693.1 glycosyltransferase [Donghicola mangrovi]